jgi:hypothetical protein
MSDFGDERETTVPVPFRHVTRSPRIPLEWERETIDLHRVDRGGGHSVGPFIIMEQVMAGMELSYPQCNASARGLGRKYVFSSGPRTPR